MDPVDYSTLTQSDVANIALQRTQHLKQWPVLGSISFRSWKRGNPKPLYKEAQARRGAILNGAMEDIYAEFEVISQWIGARPVARMIDIGCGHALIDLLFWRKYGCNLHLVDIEHTDATHHGYEEQGAGYASLEAARRFLNQNGVPLNQIRTTNPTKQTVCDADVDLIISTLSAGFHYPIAGYAHMAFEVLNSGGVLIFDARRNTEQEQALARFSKVDVIAEGEKHRRLAAIK